MADEQIPIDIQCNKLVDWLIDRRHCNIKWQTAAEVVKEKIVSALRDMPNTEEMRKLLEGSCFHYFKCLKIVNVLKDTEKDSKNIFGMYSSKRMKDWQEIVKLYEKENLHLAELSSRLLRNLNYEIPAIKKQITKCGQFQEECRKKIQDCVRNTNEAQRKYAEGCRKVGVSGTNIRRELLDLVQDLPKEFDDIGLKCRDLLPVLEYYVAFVEFSLTSNTFSESITPLSSHMSKLGNTTVYQLNHGKLPDRVMKADLNAEVLDDNADNEDNNIDWGITLETDDTMTSSDDVVDFDISVEEAGIVLETSGDEDAGKPDDNGFEIVSTDDAPRWEIEEVSIREVPNGNKLASGERVAEGEEALSVLECVKTRTQFINELMELTGFLSQRLAETQRESDVLSINQFQSAPPILQLTSVNELEAMLSLVSSIHSSLTSTKMLHLCRILDSPRFVDRLADNLSRQISLTKKYESLKQSHENSIKISETEQSSLHPKLEILISESKEWQQLIESEISKRYKDRPVHLMGAINMI
ncbi:CDK5 regulatory subunit-associated protein 3-like [Clavelina lepadiformis]|uniref:CDK5 regulatory subunit-associated protein 3-like n=1 Tax=Clavelina lepadiformis TaxID=159417 RepID=UPI004041CBD3